jgi:hypothetical protein
MMPQMSSGPAYPALPAPAGTLSPGPGHALVHGDVAVATVVIPALPVVEAAGRRESVYDLMLVGMTNELNRPSEPRKSYKVALLQVFLEWLGA